MQGDGSRGFDEKIAWNTSAEPSASDVAEKERLVREVLSLQGGLAALQQRLAAVQQECSQAETQNEVLQTYIDSITKSLATKP
ncbi:hypothetical protein MSPP1_003421 [Malassezia sp. CBS 17886]|nr:hypothetical protein MSPP1_003421 [Malassezia sp. CBS 17886]